MPAATSATAAHFFQTKAGEWHTLGPPNQSDAAQAARFEDGSWIPGVAAALVATGTEVIGGGTPGERTAGAGLTNFTGAFPYKLICSDLEQLTSALNLAWEAEAGPGGGAGGGWGGSGTGGGGGGGGGLSAAPVEQDLSLSVNGFTNGFEGASASASTSASASGAGGAPSRVDGWVVEAMLKAGVAHEALFDSYADLIERSGSRDESQVW